MERKEKRVWRGLCLMEEIRVVPLADGRWEAVIVWRDDVAIAPETGKRGDDRREEKGGGDGD